MKLLGRVLAALIVWLQCAAGQEAIRLKVRTAPVRPAGAGVIHGRKMERTHFLVQFASYPDRSLRDSLTRRGLRITGYVPDNALMVSAGPGADLSGLDVKWTGPFNPASKLSPQLAANLSPSYLVMFHSDTDMRDARGLVQRTGLDLIENPYLLPGQLVVSGSYAQLVRLAEDDAVAYILPASIDLVAGNLVAGCPGAASEAGPIGDYVQVGTGWSKDPTGTVTLQYFLQSVTEKMAETVVRSEVERAFREWERYAPIQIIPAHRADMVRTIAIEFVRGAHGDSYPFDGRGGILAHTFYPAPLNTETIAGDMHLDADEGWGAQGGIDLFSVVLHEAGHALGLGHSDIPGAVMYPYYRVTSSLSADDIAGIQSLYGSAVAPTPDPGTPSVPPQGTPVTPVTPPTPTNPGAPVPPATPANPPAGDRNAPVLSILSPASTIVSTFSNTLTIAGTASDDTDLDSVRWSTSNGDTGTANGTTHWTATIPLLTGTNAVTVRAYDASGNTSWRSLTVVRR